MCENCLRDHALITRLGTKGHDVVVIPIYLPTPDTIKSADAPVPPFYGAVRVYLEHRFPVFKRAPQWLKRWLDSPRVLRMAGRQSGMASSRNLGELTLSVLRGENGGQAAELDTLCNWLRDTQQRPDIIHLSNALLLGMARRLNATLNVPVICSLQDEDTWIDAMPEPLASQIWAEIRTRVSDVAGFITASQYYADKILPRLSIPADRVRVVHPCLDASRYSQPHPSDRHAHPVWNVLLDPDDDASLRFILQAFTHAKQHPSCANLHLHCSGISRRNNRLDPQTQRHVQCSPLMTNAEERLAFIQSSTVYTVLHRNAVAFDLSLLEAMASGIPVLQPNSGANPEILTLAHGGTLFEPDNAGALTETLISLLNTPTHLATLRQQGRQDTATRFAIDRMAQETINAYEMGLGLVVSG